jgi:hypothetical protein
VEKDSRYEQALDAIVAVGLILAFVYLGVKDVLSQQWVFIGLVGTGAGYGVWRFRKNGT